MQIDMSFKNIESTEAIKNFTREKCEKLNRYFNGKIHVTWNFSVEREEQIAHCHLVGNHMDYFGEASTSDLYASIEEAIDKIDRQLKKHKEILKNHHHKE